MSIQAIVETLRVKGYRLTSQRRELLSVLENEPQPLSVEQIAKSLKLQETDLPTLYRNLSFLEQECILKSIHLKDGKVRYELSDQYRAHHHHFVCEQCGEIEDLETCLPQSFFRQLEQEGFSIHDHSLELYGYCKSCVK